MSLVCDSCGQPGPSNVGCVFLDGEDITGWTRISDEEGRAVDVCPDCQEAS